MKLYSTLLIICLLAIGTLTAAGADTTDTIANESAGITDQVLLQRALKSAGDSDVIIDRVTLPPNTELARRWHPGQMFVYVMDGTIMVAADGADETIATAGDLLEIPYKQVYSARTTNTATSLLIFRIHDANQPIRVMMD